jgi:hypothetical protein
MAQNSAYYNRYEQLMSNGKVGLMPFVSIPTRSTDIFITYKANFTRFDDVSYQYYNSPFFNWLILYANPQYGGLEFDIPDGAVIRIPFPLQQALNDFQQNLQVILND